MALHRLEKLFVFAMKRRSVDFVAGPAIGINGEHIDRCPTMMYNTYSISRKYSLTGRAHVSA